MPVWIQVLVALAAFVTAVGVLWTRVLRPVARGLAHAERMVPLLQELTEQLHDTPNSFAILKEIIAQFRTDSGSSLRDAINRIEAAANDNRVAAQVLSVNLEATKQLAAQDRSQIARLLVLLDRVNAKVDIQAMEAGVIADNLEATHSRAEAQDESSPPGKAADAAMRRDDE